MYVFVYSTELQGGFEGEGEIGDDRRLVDKLPIQQKPVIQPLRPPEPLVGRSTSAYARGRLARTLLIQGPQHIAIRT